MPIARFFGKRGRGGVSDASRRREVERAARGRRRRRDRAGRRRRLLGAGPRRRSAATSSSGSRSPPRRPGGGSRAATGRWPRTASASRRCIASASRSTRELADAILPSGDQELVAPGAAVAPRPPRAPARDADGVGAQRLGRVPGLRRGLAILAARAAGRSTGRRFCVTDSDGRRASTAAPIEPLAGQVDVEPGEAAEDAGRGRAGAARAGAARDDPRRPPGRARRRRRRRPRAASARPPTSAGSRWCRCRRRSSPRSTPPTAARPGSTCPRPRTTSAPTTCRAPCSPTPARWRRSRRRSWRPASSRSSRRR